MADQGPLRLSAVFNRIDSQVGRTSVFREGFEILEEYQAILTAQILLQQGFYCKPMILQRWNPPGISLASTFNSWIPPKHAFTAPRLY